MPSSRKNQKIILITAIFGFLLISPFMLVFRIPTKLLGIPLSFLLLFGAWAGFIFTLRKLINHSKQPKV